MKLQYILILMLLLVLSMSDKSEAEIINNSAQIVIPSGAYLVVSDNYTSEGNGAISGNGTIDLDGNFVNNNTSGNPLSTTGTVTFSGSAQQQFSGSSISFGNVALENTNGIVVGCDASVAGNLTLTTGNFDLNGHNVVLGSAAMLTETGGRVLGTGSISATRTLNNIDENVAGLGAEITTVSNMGSTVITRQHAAAGSQGINRRYEINPTNNTGLNATLVFNYFDSELNGHTESELELFRSEDGSTWTEQSASTVDINNNTITLLGVNAFSHWTAAPAGSDAPLPIELTSFTALAGNNKVILNWITASEINNEAFLLERSDDDENFKLLTEIKGQGSTSSQTNYFFTDNAVFNGFTYYYRLADRDFNGVLTYHTTISATPNAKLVEKFALHSSYPNPFNPETTIRFDVPTGEGELHNIKLHIFNSLGQLVETIYEGNLSGGQYEVKWNGANQPSGIYFVNLQSNQFVKTGKMILLR